MSLIAFAQSNAHSSLNAIRQCNPVFKMPPLPDSARNVHTVDGAFQFAYPFSVHISKDDIEPIRTNDSLIYSLTIESAGAYSLNLIFENIQIPEGATLTIQSADGVESETINNIVANANGIYATNLIKGDKVVVRYAEFSETAATSSWTITQVSHDYTNILKEGNTLKAGAAACHKDISCISGWETEKKAVCKIVIQGITFCTGTLIANTSKSKTPYLITANHCIASNTKALRSVFYFDYEKTSCESETTTKAKTISGSTLIATSPDGKLDFSLLELSQVPPESYEPYYAGWNLSETIDKGVTCIHHPKGDVKKYSIDSNKPTTETFRTTAKSYVTDGHWKISEWDEGTTEGGSSGAVLFDKSHYIIGTLSGGEADCEHPINDFFSKISKAWNYYGSQTAQLQPWLDPINSNTTICKGYDPYSIDENTITNILPEDTLQLYSFGDKAEGLWSGVNTISWNIIAEKISTNKTIYDIVFCGEIDNTANTEDLTFYIWTGQEEPETVIAEIPFEKATQQKGNQIHIPLETPIRCDGPCWIGYKINNKSTIFNSYMAKVDIGGTCYVKHKKGWVNTAILGLPAHLSMLVHVTDIPDTLTTPTYTETAFDKQILAKTIPYPTDELFAIDSLGAIKKTTTFFYNNSEKRLAGPNENTSICFANTITNPKTEIVRGLKLAVSEIPDPNIETTLLLWNEDFTQELTKKTIKNTLLKENNFNQIPFDSLIICGKSFAYGICFDTTEYDKNISLFTYNDTESAVDGYFYSCNSWNKYANYNLKYNIGIQPITTRTTYHYNPDSANILQYPITSVISLDISAKESAIFYPSICTNEVHIQFKNEFHNVIQYTITNINGILVKQDRCELQAGKFTIPITTLPQGLYTIQVETTTNKYKGKFIHIQ